MITEDYISFETAKLLKEKGFDERCVCYYNTESLNKYGNPVFDSIDMPLSNSDLEQSDHYYVCYSAPTLQMAMKWLRKVHKLGVFPSTYTNIVGSNITYAYGTAIVNLNTHELMTSDSMERDTYEEACEAAIKYCLENLI